MIKRIIVSGGMLVFVGAIVVGATGAFFSDTEVSKDNVFTAGAIDLTVDDVQHYNNAVCVAGQWQLFGTTTPAVDQYPVIGSACDGTWALTSLGPQHKFFNFGDVKPGDSGENTISLHIDNNPAYACLDIGTTGNNENGINAPEVAAGDVTADPNGGELAQNIHVLGWLDQGATLGFQGTTTDPTEGDNIWEQSEPSLFSSVALSSFGSTTTIPLADSTINGGAPLPPTVTSYIGLFWCAGAITGGAGSLGCDGSTMGNNTQTDSATSTVQFRVTQSRNQPTFKCATSTP